MSPDPAAPPPQPMAEPQTVEDFIRRGWTLHVQGDLKRSEEDFRQAIQRDPKSIEGHYGLGLSLKLQRRQEQALLAFQETIDLVKAGNMQDDPARATMLRHLSGWHISTIQSGIDQEPEP